jgi:hypothetical protein
MPHRAPEDLPDRMLEYIPDRMPEGRPDRMPDKMSARMPEDLPVTKCINVMVGITRSKTIVVFLVQHLHICNTYCLLNYIYKCIYINIYIYVMLL